MMRWRNAKIVNRKLFCEDVKTTGFVILVMKERENCARVRNFHPFFG